MVGCILPLVALTLSVGISAESPGVREPTFEERLYYSVAAKLARHGVRAYCSGIERHGARVRIDSCEIASKHGLAVVRDVEVSIAGESTWLPMFRIPAVKIDTGSVAIARAHSVAAASSKPVVAKTESPSRGLLGLLPVHVSVQRIVARELRLPLAVAFFGWPFATEPSGEVKLLAPGAIAKMHVAVKGDHVAGKVLARVAPSIVRTLRGTQKVDYGQGTVAVSADFDLARDMLLLKASAVSDAVCLQHPRFGEGRACDLSIRGAARFAMSKERLFVDAAHARFSNVNTQASTAVYARGSLPFVKDDEDELTFNVTVPAQDVDQVLNTIPHAWRTGLFGFELDGTFSAAFGLTFQGDDFTFDPFFRFDGVKVKNAPPGQDPRRLNGAISWKLPFPYPHTASLWPEAGYVSLSRIPSVLVDAVRISEDAAFYGHDGFDRTEIAKAIVDIKEGAGARGASTITQQLAKNLYFDGDRNLTRKVEEAIVTAALEASIPKWRLLEIYLNVIEWGDGVFGVQAAARRYFKKSASEITGSEAAFLAGIIPAPRRVDREMRRDGYSAWAEKRALRVSKFLCEIGKLDPETCADAAMRAELATASY